MALDPLPPRIASQSLNIFNSRCVLASPETATDSEYGFVEAVVAHEYFHNWTGNRVTCRDWFQLSLKEGLTVYRDQEFTADVNSRPVKRIEDASRLRRAQFPQDAGPMAHPVREGPRRRRAPRRRPVKTCGSLTPRAPQVRPDSYIKMDNFYTGSFRNVSRLPGATLLARSIAVASHHGRVAESPPTPASTPPIPPATFTQ